MRICVVYGMGMVTDVMVGGILVGEEGSLLGILVAMVRSNDETVYA
jgi:hypothetical protein